MIVVKWSACLPSTLTIRVRIPLKPTIFPAKYVFEKNENKQKRGRGFHIKISISTDQDLSSSAESYKALYDRSLRL